MTEHAEDPGENKAVSGKSSLISYRDFRKKFSEAFISLQSEPFKPPDIKNYQQSPTKETSKPAGLKLPPIGVQSNAPTIGKSPAAAAAFRSAECAQYFVGEDRPRKLQLTMEDVLAIQTMFARSFPLHPELNRVSEEDIVLGIAEATSLQFAHMIRSVCLFLHMTVMLNLHPHAPKGRKPQEDYELMMLEIYEGYNDLNSKLKKRKTHLMFVYPLLLLSLRVTVETVFRSAFPAWFNGPIGDFLMLTLNFVISSIFDPDHYSAASSFLTSYETSIALRRNARQQRKPLTSRFYTTSSLVQSVCSQPSSASTRVFMGSGKPSHDPMLPSTVGDEQLRSVPAKRVLYKVALAKVRNTSRLNAAMHKVLKNGEDLFKV